MTFYNFVLIAAIALLGGLTNIRIGYFLADKKWKMSAENGLFMIIVGTVCAMVVLVFVGMEAIHRGGNFYGLAALVGTIPFVGLCWAYIIASIKAIELVLLGLARKVTV